MTSMKVSVITTCPNCDFWHSGSCDMGMRKKRTIGKGKMVSGVMQGKYLVCDKFRVWGYGQMKDKSIRKLTITEARTISLIMGFDILALDDYIDRWVEIKIQSPKKIKSCGGQCYKNKEMK